MAGSATITGTQHYVQGIGHPKSDATTENAPAMLSTDENGNVTGLVNPSGGILSLGSSVPVNSNIYEYSEAGAVYKRKMPKLSRIISKGSMLFAPTALSGTAARTVALYTGAGFLVNGSSDASKPVQIDYLNGAYASSSWTGLNLPIPSDGLLQAMVFVDEIDNGALNPLVGSLQITLNSASGNINYVFSSAAFKPGWNTLQLWNPATDANYVCSNGTISYISGTPTLNFTENITGISVICNTPNIGSRILFGGIYTQTKIKPMFMFTFDTSSQDIFTNFTPAFKSKGLTAAIRCGGADSYRTNGEWVTSLTTALDDGFDVYNGSWSRLSLNNSTTAASFAKEVGLQQNFSASKGLTRGSNFFSSVGNSMPKQSIYRSECAKFGVTMAKNGSRQGIANIFGVAGLDDPLALTCKGFGGRTAMLNQIAGTIYVGGLMVWFGHECPIGGGSYTDGSSPGNGGGLWAEDALYFADYLAKLVAAGTLDVVSPSQLDNILDGIS